MAAAPDRILRRLGQLKSERGVFEAHWQEVRDVLLPVVRSFTGQDTKGGKTHTEMFDSTGENALERLAAGLDGMLTNPATEWLALRPWDPRERPDYAGARWLDRAGEVLLSIFASTRSGFPSCKHELYLDTAGFGTGVLYAADRPADLPMYQARPLVEAHLTEGADGRVDGIWRSFQMTARQAVEQWDEKAGAKVVKAAREHPDQLFEFCHAVYPRKEAVRSDALPTPSHRLPWASVWPSVADKAIIDEKGYHEFPFMVPRWITRPGEVYGRGPGMKALPDAKMLQRMSKVTVVAGELVIAPPLLVSDDGVIDYPNLAPGGLNTYRTGAWNYDPIKPLVTGGRPDIGEEMMAAVRGRIERAFYADLLAVMQDPKMTATQVIKLDEETLRILGPIVARMQGEFLSPLIERTFGIAWCAGFLDPPPPSLQGRQLRIEYLSPIARAQRFSELTAISRTLELAQPLVDRNPALADVFDEDAMIRHVADVTGFPMALLRDPETVQQMRAARQQAQQEQATTQTAIEGAPAAAKLLKALPGLAGGAGGRAAA
jgi:hypothetical protein